MVRPTEKEKVERQIDDAIARIDAKTSDGPKSQPPTAEIADSDKEDA